MSKLTVKQQRFADEYIISGNATEAARKAGYSHKTANRIATENLSKPVIRSYIDERLDQLKKESIADQDEVLQYLTAVLRGKEKEATLLGLGMGEQKIVDIDVSAKDRIKAAELLGKRHAMWTDKKHIDGDLDLSIVVDYGDED